jgi:hypothetical protein
MGCVTSLFATMNRRISDSEYCPVTKDMFLFKNVVGEGGFGKVFSAMVSINSTYLSFINLSYIYFSMLNKENGMLSKRSISMIFCSIRLV